MIERAKPYIGVSGVGSTNTQQQIIERFESTNLCKKRTLLLGVKALHKSQWLDQPWTRDPEWDIVGRHAFQTVLNKDRRALNIAQAYFDQACVGEKWYREAFLERIYARGASWIDGIQFDSLPWHNNADLLRFLHETKEQYPDTLVLLQCHEQSMQRYSPNQLVQKLGAYAAALDYVLFDASHGKGIRLDVERLSPYIEEAFGSSALDHVGVALAGGLCDTVVREELPSLVERFPELSWDAEGKLHPRNATGGMPLSLDTTMGYFEASRKVLT